MDEVLKKFTDPYERKARLYPTLMAGLPAIVLIGLYTDWLDLGLENALLIAVVAAVLFWLAGQTRQLGKAVERRVVPTWEGMPSVTMLRHRDPNLDRYTTERYHSAAERLTGMAMPTGEEEEADPADADERYHAVTSALLPKTRDTGEYALLFKENIAYGFWRNLLGLKPIGLCVAITVGVIGLWLDRDRLLIGQLPEGSELALVVVGIVASLTWLTVTENAVREAANSYARRLLEALDTL